MSKDALQKGLATAAATLAAYQGHADTSLSETISLSQLLNASSGDYTGSFSISSLLATSGLTGAPVLSAAVTAAGYSAPTADVTTVTTSSNYTQGYAGYVVTGYYTYPIYSQGSSCYAWGGCYYYYYQSGTGYAATYGYASYGTVTNLTTKTNTDNTQDTIGLKAGTAAAAGTVSNLPAILVKGSPAVTGYAGNGTYGYNTVLSESDTITQGYYGSLSAQAVLSAHDLFSLTSTGALAFDVSSQVGATNLTSITLAFTVGAPVPLPLSATLLGSGLAALATAARRRRKRDLLLDTSLN
jgi:hypothetical protein